MTYMVKTWHGKVMAGKLSSEVMFKKMDKMNARAKEVERYDCQGKGSSGEEDY